MIIDLNLENEFVFEIELIGLVQSPTFFKLSLVNTGCRGWMQGLAGWMSRMSCMFLTSRL